MFKLKSVCFKCDIIIINIGEDVIVMWYYNKSSVFMN